VSLAPTILVPVISTPVQPDLQAAAEIRLTPAEFTLVRELVRRGFGLNLQEGKETLVAARLSKQIRAGRFRSFTEYFRHVTTDSTGEPLIALIDALTTNHTGFLRERQHFQYLMRVVLPQYLDRPQLSIWSAASSSGEEPYSVLFTLLHALADRPAPKVSILATDISTRVLAAARRAVYPTGRLTGLPAAWLHRFLEKEEGQSAYRVKDEVAKQVTFRRLNLMEPFSAIGRFPIIFCRNVMIYFDHQTREQLVLRLVERLEPGGYLFVGHAESLLNITHGLDYVGPAIYRRPPSGAK
jgi:chemotaxis protein methyltransferase CheR